MGTCTTDDSSDFGAQNRFVHHALYVMFLLLRKIYLEPDEFLNIFWVMCFSALRIIIAIVVFMSRFTHPEIIVSFETCNSTHGTHVEDIVET